MGEINNEFSQNTQADTTKPKKKRLTKVVFYIMAVLLLATTAFSGYNSYRIYLLDKHLSNSDSSGNKEQNTSNEQDSSGNNTIPEGHTLISDDDLEAIKNDAHNSGRDDILNSVKNMMENGDTTLKMLRILYPNHLIYNQSGGFVFKDINTSLAMNNFKKENFKILENENSIPTNVEYYENDMLKSYTGIDVSKHNGTIDWKKVSEAGIDFAIIRAGNRGYGSEGKLLIDEKFSENAKGATDNGIAIGAYIFSEAITVEEVIEEADLILSQIEPYDITYPIIIDIEDIASDEGRNEKLTPAELTDIALAFCKHIKDAGYTPMIYGNLKGLIGMLEIERLEGIEKWYAYYGNELYFPYDVSIWQYTSSGIVPGISGIVDMNISFKNYSE